MGLGCGPAPARQAAGPRRGSYARQLALVCSTDFVVWLGGGAIYPYLPVFLKEDAHASVGMVGVVAGAYFLAVFACAVPAGRLSDRIGRKPMMIAGTLLYALSTLLFLTTANPWWFVAFRIVEGAGAACVVPAAQAFVAEITTNHDRGRAYGWLATAQYGGLIVGPAIAWPLYALGGGHGARAFYAIFVFGTVVTAAAGAALWLWLREPETSRQAQAAGRRPSLRSLLTWPIVAVVLVVATAQFAMGGFEVVWSIFLRDLHASITVIGLTWVLFSAPLLLSFVGGRAADRYSRFRLMFLGFAVQAVCWLLVPLFRDPLLYLLVLPLDGLAFAFALPAKQGFLVQLSPRSWLGSVLGVEQAAAQIAAFAGTLGAPLVYERIGAGWFAVAGLVALAGLVAAAPTLRREWRVLAASGATVTMADATDLTARSQISPAP